jgi:ATPase subunit of ABC transporter with duplicated ATPase domains
MLAAALTGTVALAQDVPEQPAGHFEQGVFVPEGNTLAEVLEQQAANKAQAEVARQQEDRDAAQRAAYEQAREAYQAELARVEEEKRAIEAQAAKVAADYEAAMTKWRADVAACEGGDKTRCAPVAPD